MPASHPVSNPKPQNIRSSWRAALTEGLSRPRSGVHTSGQANPIYSAIHPSRGSRERVSQSHNFDLFRFRFRFIVVQYLPTLSSTHNLQPGTQAIQSGGDFSSRCPDVAWDWVTPGRSYTLHTFTCWDKLMQTKLINSPKWSSLECKASKYYILSRKILIIFIFIFSVYF